MLITPTPARMLMATVAAGRLLLTLFTVSILTSCGGSGVGVGPPSSAGPPSSGPPASPGPGGDPPASPPASPGAGGDPSSEGRYVGIVTIGSAHFFADAVLTSDGALRLYVGGQDAGSSSGALELSKPGSSMQFVGQVPPESQAGTGQVFGQHCTTPAAAPFCGEAAEASVNLTFNSHELRGEIEVAMAEGVETWSLELAKWSNYYEFPARGLSGQYRELLAEFERDGDVVISIDGAGKLFFQGASSGAPGMAARRRTSTARSMSTTSR
jgi:hypothetical protein